MSNSQELTNTLIDTLKNHTYYYAAKSAAKETAVKLILNNQFNATTTPSSSGGKKSNPRTSSTSNHVQPPQNMFEATKTSIEDLSLKIPIRNLIFRLALDEKKSFCSFDPIPQVEAARKVWCGSINSEIRAVEVERGEPIVRKLSEGEGGENSSSGGEPTPPITTPTPATPKNKSKIRFIFDSDDLLDAIKHIDPTNNSKSNHPNVGQIKLKISTPSMINLRETFAELHPTYMQIGVDDFLNDSSRFIAHRLNLGNKVIGEGYVPIARQYAKFGIPASLRSKIYRTAMGLSSEFTNKERSHYDGLRELVEKVTYPITDELFRMDVENVSNDFTYFPFVEVLTGVVMSFSRDPWLLDNADVVTHEPLIFKNEVTGDKMNVPSSGVHPFKRLVNFAAPLSFVYQDEEHLYYTFRSLYASFFCRLNVIDSREGFLIHLCKTFEDLLLSNSPSLYAHLLSIKVHPLQVAFTWIHFAFSTFLDIEQVLLLWDRIIGFDSLQLLPILSVSIFLFKSEMLLCCTDLDGVKVVLGDGSRLKVVPLLQSFLFLNELKVD